MLKNHFPIKIKQSFATTRHKGLVSSIYSFKEKAKHEKCFGHFWVIIFKSIYFV